MDLKRMRFVCAALLAGVALFALTTPSAAVVIDFEVLQAPGSGATSPILTYTEDGFLLTSDNTAVGFASWQTGSSAFAGSTGLFNSFQGGTTTLTKIGGGTFDLTAIDLSFLDPAQSGAATVTFTGTTSSSATVTQTFTIGALGFQPFLFTGFDDVVSVQWVLGPAFADYHQFDNIVIDQAPLAAAATPEPSSTAVLGSALSAFGAWSWRRRRGRPSS